MLTRLRLSALLILFLLVLWLPLQNLLPEATRLELTDGETGRKILAVTLPDGEEIRLTWKNSIFGQVVTEVFRAEDGQLVLTEITFADPQGEGYPMPVTAKDVDDLYHTGGAFQAQGLSRPFSRVVYRIGEIGNPKMQVRERVVEFKREVGFGGRVFLATRRATLVERLADY